MTLVVRGAQRDVRPRQCIPLPFGPYSICFLYVPLVCNEGGLTTEGRQPLWTSVHFSESMRFQTHVYWIFFLIWWVLPPLKLFDTFFKNLYVGPLSNGARSSDVHFIKLSYINPRLHLRVVHSAPTIRLL